MPGTPFFSVVIDNCNYGRFLGRAIQSALDQDLPAEIVVVDDGSTDDSRHVIESFGDRVRGVFQPNQGQATAFNRGFSEARGEVVCLLDSDDEFRPGKLSAFAPLFDDKAVGVAQHYLQDTDVSGKPVPQNFPEWPSRYSIDDFLDARTHFAATSGLAFRKTALAKALPIPKDLFYYLDDFLIVRALFETRLANVPRKLGIHRLHGGNWCAGGYENPRKLAVDFEMRRLFDEHLERWLAQFGKALTPRFLELRRLEVWRRRVLFEALNARPAAAWEAWRSEETGGGFGSFRKASLFLAVLSPSLYLSAYSAYARASRLRDLRLRLLPER